MPTNLRKVSPEVTGVTIIGIDPGATGGLCAINPFMKMFCLKMPDTPQEINEWLLKFMSSTMFCVIEKVGGFIGEGQPGSRMFNFGKSAGIVEGLVIAHRIPYEMCMPQRWQKHLGIPPRKKTMSKTEWKSFLHERSMRLYPDVKILKPAADAVLITEYGRRIWNERNR